MKILPFFHCYMDFFRYLCSAIGWQTIAEPTTTLSKMYFS